LINNVVLVAVFVFVLIMPSVGVEYAGDLMYNFTMQSPYVGSAQVSMDAAHIGVTITPSAYSTDLSDAISHVLAGYSVCLQRMPNYNGYLRIGIRNTPKSMLIYDVDAFKMREAIRTGDYKPVVADMYAGRREISTYMSDGYGDVTKSVNTPYGRMSASAGNWL
jgi:hypothetical protein